MIHRTFALVILICLFIIMHSVPVDSKFLFHKKPEFLGRLFKKITIQPKYCFSFNSCGWANSANEQAGVQLQPNEYPWLALVYDPHDMTMTYPGTLINDKYIISSASNFHGKSPHQLKAKLGYHFNCQYEKTSVTFSVSEILIHPLYANSPDNFGNDIALIRLSNSVNFNHEIQPICLTKKGNGDWNGMVGHLASWNVPPVGSFDQTKINCSPRKYKLPITSGFKCSETNLPVSESCIGVYGSRSLLCHGDSGAGIFHRNGNSYELIGVLSNRQSCGLNNFGSPLIIKDPIINSTFATTMAINKTGNATSIAGRQLHTLNQSDPLMIDSAGDHYYDPLPVFTRIDYHWDWIIENTKDSCYCKARFQLTVRFNKFH